MLGYSFDWDRVVDYDRPGVLQVDAVDLPADVIKRALPTKPPCRSTGAQAASACLRTKKWWTACASAAAARSSAARRASGCSRITKYADRLIDDLDDVDFINRVKIQQRNWIGRSEGAEVDLRVRRIGDKLTVYTTRCDTLFGVTYMVISPEHPYPRTAWKDKLDKLGRRGGLPRAKPRTRVRL